MKKIRDSGREWIPYVVVLGDKEMESGTLSVTVRANSEKVKMSVVRLKVCHISHFYFQGSYLGGFL
ncbi:MAG: His/Gly/Thr/Pro-type tRNA ligase C-terminal domain-containing protein [Methanosarcinales archaeon]